MSANESERVSDQSTGSWRMKFAGEVAENVLDRAGEEALYVTLRRFWHPVMWADELDEGPAVA